MERHSGYEDIREQVLNKNISSFHEFAQYVPKKVLARDLGMTEVKFQKCLEDHGRFSIEEVYRLSLLANVQHEYLIDIVEGNALYKIRREFHLHRVAY